MEEFWKTNISLKGERRRGRRTQLHKGLTGEASFSVTSAWAPSDAGAAVLLHPFGVVFPGFTGLLAGERRAGDT